MVDVLGRAVVKVVGELDPRSFQASGAEAGSLLTRSLATTAKAAGAGIGVLLGGAIAKGFQRLSSIEEAEAKLRGLGNSAKTVTQVMEDALAAVKGTAFGLGDAAGIAASAVASGVKPGADLERTLKLVADAATIAGTDLGSMGAIFNKVAATGKIQGEVIAQLGERGIPIIQLLAKELGVTAAEVVDMASQGKIGFDTFRDAMEAGLGGAALESGKTFRGALNNAGAALGRFGAALLGTSFKGAPQVFGAITAKIDELTPKAEAFAKAVGPPLRAAFSTTFTVIKTSIDVVRTAFNGLVTVVSNPIFQAFAAVIATLLIPAFTVWVAQVVALNTAMAIFVIRATAISVATKLWTAAQWLLNAALIANPVGIVIAALAALVVLFVVLWKRSETFRDVVTGAWDAIKEKTVEVWNAVGKFISDTWEEIKQEAATVKEFFTDIWDGIKSGAEFVWNAIKADITLKINAIKAVAEGIKTVFQNVWNGIKIAGIAAFDTLKGALNTVIRGVNNAIDVVNAIPKVPNISKIPLLASGARNFPGGLAVVGERGPELVNLPRGSDVFSNRESKQLATTSSTNVTINQVFNGPTSGAEARSEIDWSLKYGTRFPAIVSAV